MAQKKNRDGKIMRKHSRIKHLDNFLKKYIEPMVVFLTLDFKNSM